MQKEKLKIGFDCDDLIIPYSESVLDHFNDKYKSDMKMKDLYSYSIAECISRHLKISSEKVYDSIVQFDRSLLKDIRPYDEAIAGIEKLFREEHELYLIDKRRKELQGITENMVNNYFKNKFMGTYPSNGTFSIGPILSKPEAAKAFELDVSVEVCSETSRDIARTGIDVIEFEKPWSMDQGAGQDLGGKIYSVKSWDGILGKIDELSNESFQELTHQ